MWSPCSLACPTLYSLCSTQSAEWALKNVCRPWHSLFKTLHCFSYREKLQNLVLDHKALCDLVPSVPAWPHPWSTSEVFAAFLCPRHARDCGTCLAICLEGFHPPLLATEAPKEASTSPCGFPSSFPSTLPWSTHSFWLFYPFPLGHKIPEGREVCLFPHDCLLPRKGYGT